MKKRQAMRLNDYDYSQAGYYYVTICTQEKKCLFGEIKNGGMILNDAGYVVKRNWNTLPQHFPNIELDEFIVMPTHLHGIIIIVGAPFMGARNNRQANTQINRAGTSPAPTLGNI